MVLKYFFPVCCDLEEQTPPHPLPPPVPVSLYYLRCHLVSALFVNSGLEKVWSVVIRFPAS